MTNNPQDIHVGSADTDILAALGLSTDQLIKSVTIKVNNSLTEVQITRYVNNAQMHELKEVLKRYRLVPIEPA